MPTSHPPHLSPLSVPASPESEKLLLSLAQVAVQQLADRLFSLPATKHKMGRLVDLPAPTTPLPREKPVRGRGQGLMKGRTRVAKGVHVNRSSWSERNPVNGMACCKMDRCLITSKAQSQDALASITTKVDDEGSLGRLRGNSPPLRSAHWGLARDQRGVCHEPCKQISC